MKRKFKIRAKINPEETKAFRKVENELLHTLARNYMKELEPFFTDENSGPQIYKAYMDGFNQAKSMIIQFLMQKQMGYGEAFFFKISDIEEIGEKSAL